MFTNISYINKYLIGQIRKIYFMALPETKADFKKSRIYFTTADSAAQTIAQLAGGTFLASIMSYCGISDAKIGIITSLISLAAIFQLLMINFIKRIKKYKLLVCFMNLQRALFAFIYLIPLFSIGKTERIFLIIFLYFIGQVFVQIGTPAYQDWIASLVPSRLRGKYFSIKDAVAVLVVSSVMLIGGMVLDYYKIRDIKTGFIIIGIFIFLLTMINFVSLSKMKEPKISYVNEEGKEMHGRLAKKARDLKEAETLKEDQPNLVKEMKDAFRDRKFRRAFMVQFLYIFAFYICTPFNSSYQIKDLSLPYTFIMLVSFIGNLYRIYIMPKLGRVADKYGMAKLLRYSLFALGLYFVAMAFTIPENAYPMYIVGVIFSSTAWAFIGIGLFGIQLDFYSNEKRILWLALTASICGISGFLVSILGGVILNYLQKNPLVLFGRMIYAQQILNLLGFLIIMISVFYIKFRIETIKVDSNHVDGRI